MKIKIKGVKNNHLKLLVDDIMVGELDLDHDIVNITKFTEKQFEKRFNSLAVALNFELNEYYNELVYNEELDLLVPTTDYKIIFAEEGEEDDEYYE